MPKKTKKDGFSLPMLLYHLTQMLLSPLCQASSLPSHNHENASGTTFSPIVLLPLSNAPPPP